jgi:hypothetical protein
VDVRCDLQQLVQALGPRVLALHLALNVPNDAAKVEDTFSGDDGMPFFGCERCDAVHAATVLLAMALCLSAGLTVAATIEGRVSLE